MRSDGELPLGLRQQGCYVCGGRLIVFCFSHYIILSYYDDAMFNRCLYVEVEDGKTDARTMCF